MHTNDDDKPKRRKRSNTVHNPTLYEDIKDWVKRREQAPEGEHVPMGDYTAKSIIEVCNKLTYHHSFIGYTWKDLMISDGIENLILAMPNFNIEYDNPHAYMTRVAFNAFVRRIKKENRENEKKAKYFIAHVYDSTNDGVVTGDIQDNAHHFYLGMLEKLGNKNK
tara:strand:+ start:1542 stop:2036 length:495 start_codon:yes stop_codon:yes gene_type:complete